MPTKQMFDLEKLKNLCFFFSEIMILGHGANTMTLEEARLKLCAQAK